MRLLQLAGLFLLLVGLTLSPVGVQAQPTTNLASVPNAPDQICPLPIGSPVPEMELQSLDGKPFNLASALRIKPTILIYFRGGW